MKRILKLKQFKIDTLYIFKEDNWEEIFKVKSLGNNNAIIRGITANKEQAITVNENTFSDYRIYELSREQDPEYYL